MYIELASALPVFHRNIIVPLNDHKQIQKFIEDNKNEGIYYSICKYTTEDIAKAPYVCPLVFDIDAKDLEQAREDCVWVYEELIFKQGFKPEDVDIFFSGGKGFHLVIDEKVIGITPMTNLMELYKKFAERLKRESPHKTIDTVIYEKRRVLRMPFSQHQDTKLFKNIIPIEMLYARSITEIQDYCKERVLPTRTPREIVVNQEFLKYLNNLKLLLDETPDRGERKPVETIDDEEEVVMEGCVRAMFAQAPVQGERNSKTFNLALWCKSKGLSKGRALQMLHGWSGLPEIEVRNTIESAYTSDFGWGCGNNPFMPDEYKNHCCKSNATKITDDTFVSFDDVLEKTEKQLLEPRKNTNLTTGYKEIDDLLSGVMENEFLVLCGLVGGGKSLFAANMALANAKQGKKVAFMSLEMMNEQVAQRYIQQETGISSKKFVDQNYTEGEVAQIKEAVVKFKKRLPLYFFNRDNIYTVDNIEKAVKKAIELFGLDILIIDHLRYISRDPKGKENEELDRICTKLQQISQRYKVAIVLLAHFNKGDDTKPREMSQLLGSNAVYREATKILQVWRKIPSDITEEVKMSAKDKLVQFICQKNRFGSTGVVCMEFDKSTQNFVSPNTALLKKIEEVQNKTDQRSKMANDIIELDEIDKLL